MPQLLELPCPMLPTPTRLHPDETGWELSNRLSSFGTAHALLEDDFPVCVNSME
jgi:hypothetical protein